MTALGAGTPRTASPSSRGLGTARLQQLRDLLSPRDLAVLTTVADHRFLTTTHIEQLHFVSHASSQSGSRTARRVLRRLAHHRLLIALPRRVGGMTSGSTPGVWHISLAGYRLLGLGESSGGLATLSSSRVREPSQRFVAHCLAIADVHLALLLASRAGAFGLTAVDIEPRCWRTYAGQFGGSETLKPDLAAATTSTDGLYEDRWFVEVDLGSEHLPTVLAKCAQYEAYRRLGDEQQRHGVFPLVLWVTPDPGRAAKLRAAIGSSRGLDQSLYRVVATAAVAELEAAGGGPASAQDGGSS